MAKPLFELYRPASWDDVVGQSHVVKAIAMMRERNAIGGHAFWLTGQSGTGKTTIGYLIAGDVCDADNFQELDAGEITPARLNEIEASLSQLWIGSKPGRAILVNEAHGLRKDTTRKLLVMLERIPAHVAWIFTTTDAGQQALFDGIDSHPLLSRCIEFRLQSEELSYAFATRAKEIAEAEGMGERPISAYVDLVKRCRFNFRMVLSRIEAGEMLADTAPAIRPESVQAARPSALGRVMARR